VLTSYQAALPTFSSAGSFSDNPTAGLATLSAHGYMTAPTDADKGKFRTKSLRQIAETAPYMHDGVLADLAAVVDFYDVGGGPGAPPKAPLLVPLNLPAQDKPDLVALMQPLPGAPTPGALERDTSR